MFTINCFILLFSSSFFALNINAEENKSIYGADNRRLVRTLEPNNQKDEILKKYSLSILAQIPSYRINVNKQNDQMTIETKSLKEGLKFCPEESFSDEPIVSSCTAFLVAPNLILTAGHCVKDKFDCKKQTWVIDYENAFDSTFQNGEISFPKEKTFQCAELISKIENTKVDYALIKIDRPISDRPILKIRSSGKTESDEKLIIFGHPLGMPLIVADQIFIRDNSMDYIFKTNADAFSGNSGSPLIGEKSGLVEGILIRGDEDFYLDKKFNCHRSYQCHDKECRGETILRSSYLPNKLISN